MLGGMIAKYASFISYYVGLSANAIALLIILLIIDEPFSLKKRPLFKENFKIVNRNFIFKRLETIMNN